jgi:CHASE3 domain sensor protein
MTDKDDEIIALLRELVQVSKENATRYADAVKRSRRSILTSRIILVAVVVIILASSYFFRS